MNKKTMVATWVAVLALLGIGSAWSLFFLDENAMAQHDEHDGHSHEEPGQVHEDDAGDKTRESGVHDELDDADHGAESVVHLSDEERTKFGVVVASAGSAQLATQIRLPGEIVLNADRVAHIVPRAPGIVREVLSSVGDNVQAGEVMAWLESAELGEAKVDYHAKLAEVSGCTVDLMRAQEVHDNTIQLLEVLKSSPSLETLRDMSGSAMGENRSILVSAYAELVLSEAAYLRERPLFEKKIASERDYQTAEAEYKKADALYAATRDSTDFKIRRALMEAKRSQRVREIELRGARQRLYVMGLTFEEIAELEAHARLQTPWTTEQVECTDPNCKNCKQGKVNAGSPGSAEQREAEEKLAWYPLRAPFDATVIEKHLVLGEKHSDESDAFTIADLTSVWVNIAVYQKDLDYVREGMSVTVSVGGMPSAEGTVAYLAPVVDRKMRTALARVVLPNPDGVMRPGLFVSAQIAIGQGVASVVIPKSAVQRIGGQSIVFLDTGDGFQPVSITLGRSNESHIEVLSGLAAGQRYVTQGAFELKAIIVTRGLDAHAGHGH